MAESARESFEVGPYRVLDVLGEGGMGIVYAAEQRKPFFRRVALKVIKVGMDTKEVLARFEAERQALALLDHPNVAKVLDAGATPEGRPYFAMELVRGLPITRYCDEGRLTLRERVGLLLQACAALQHAHEHGIIHRDIKPTNLLVTEIDGQPVVKVIDFGLAKAINQRLTERTLFTEEGRIIGTPEYMSPEQAETSAQDVDARSDVFSLGVVLYELLSGALPFDFRALRAKGYLELQRSIREEDAPTPYRRLSILKNSLDQILVLRRCRLQDLAASLRNGLDAVTMKAIAKQRRDRYASCAELAADLRRYLAGEPVSARRLGMVGSLRVGSRRFQRRHPAVLPAVLLAAVSAGGVWLLSPASAHAPNEMWVRVEDPSLLSSGRRDSPAESSVTSAAAPATLALLVGVNRTPAGSESGTPILGAENDVDRLRAVLIDRFGFDPAGIKTLKTPFATHAAIVTAFDEHLIRQAGPETRVVFSYSGTGSRVKDPTQRRGAARDGAAEPFDTTIAAYDSRAVSVDGGFDVTDDELYSLLAALKARDVVVIADSCRSGGLLPTSAALARVPGVPSSPPPLTHSFWPSDVPFFDDDQQGPLPSVIHFAACAADESAQEIKTKQGSFGSMTWSLSQVLSELPAGESWGEVATIVRARVAQHRADQNVVLSGDANRPVFGGRAQPVATGYRADRKGPSPSKRVLVAAGKLHGIDVGTELRLFAPDGSEVGLATVLQADAMSCDAELKGLGDVPAAVMRAFPSAAPRGPKQLSVALGAGIDASLLADLPEFRLVTARDEAGDYALRIVDDHLALFDRDGERVAEMARERLAVQHALRRESRHHALWSGAMQPGPLQLSIAVEPMGAERAAKVQRPVPPALVRPLPSGAIVGARELSPDAGGSAIEITVTNDNDQALHLAILSVSQDREINLIYGEDSSSLVAGRASVTRTVLVGQPPGWPAWKPFRDRYLVIATEGWTDFTQFTTSVSEGMWPSRDRSLPPMITAGERPRLKGESSWGIRQFDLQVVTLEVFEASGR